MPWSASTRSAVCGVSSVTSANRAAPAGSPSTVETQAVGTGAPRAITSPSPGCSSRISRSCASRSASRTPPAEKISAFRSEGSELTRA